MILWRVVPEEFDIVIATGMRSGVFHIRVTHDDLAGVLGELVESPVKENVARITSAAECIPVGIVNIACAGAVMPSRLHGRDPAGI